FVDLRRRVAKLAKPVGDGDKGNDILDQMRDLTVRLAVAHRRTVGAARRIHQDRGVLAERQPLIAARRSVALDALAMGFGEARAVEEAADHRNALGTLDEFAVAG